LRQLDPEEEHNSWASRAVTTARAACLPTTSALPATASVNTGTSAINA
jgi:hypothetical protein